MPMQCHPAHNELSVKLGIHADPNLVRQITVKDFNKFHDRVAPGLNRSLFTGKRMEAARAGMLIAT